MQLDRSATDDGERERRRAQLYAPPRDNKQANSPTKRARKPSRRGGMSMAQAQQLMAETAAEDAKLARRKTTST